DGDIDLRPRASGPIEELAVRTLAEDIERVGHFSKAYPADLWEIWIAAPLSKRIPDTLGEHRTRGLNAVSRRVHDALTYEAPIRASHAGFLFILPSRDHEVCRNFELAQHIALIARVRVVVLCRRRSIRALSTDVT